MLGFGVLWGAKGGGMRTIFFMCEEDKNFSHSFKG